MMMTLINKYKSKPQFQFQSNLTQQINPKTKQQITNIKMMKLLVNSRRSVQLSQLLRCSMGYNNNNSVRLSMVRIGGLVMSSGINQRVWSRQVCYGFSTEKQQNKTPPPNQPQQQQQQSKTQQSSSHSSSQSPSSSQSSSSPSSQPKNHKLLHLKELFQTQMTKYNLKGLLKMYQILKHHSIPLSPRSLKEFDYRLLQQLHSLDHQSTNSLLEMSLRNGQVYQAKGSNKLLRGINVKLQKGKLALTSDHCYKTLTLLTQLHFPKPTITKVLYKLVQQTQTQKRMLYHINNLSALKISLMAMEMVEVDMEVKKRVLENLLVVKPKGVVELAYFYSVLKVVGKRLEETVAYEAQKKSVYDLAFNPYSMYEYDNQEDSTPSSTSANKGGPQQPTPQSTPPPSINPAILSRLTLTKQKILQDTFSKLDLSKVSQQLYNQLHSLMKDEEELEWREMKQLAVLLLGNGFGEEGKLKREVVGQLVGRVVGEGLGGSNINFQSATASTATTSQRLIRVPQFIIFMQQLSQHQSPSTTSSPSSLQPLFTQYHSLYSLYMSLQQTLLFTYHRSKILNTRVPLNEIRELILGVDYGLNAEEFVWLHRVLGWGRERHTVGDREVVKGVWEWVEARVDVEIKGLRQQREQKQREREQKIKGEREEMGKQQEKKEKKEEKEVKEKDKKEKQQQLDEKEKLHNNKQ